MNLLLFEKHNNNKLNDLILNLTPENMTQHSRIEWQSHTKEAQQPPKWVVWEIGPAKNTTRCSELSKRRLPDAWHPSQLAIDVCLDKSKRQIHLNNKKRLKFATC